MNSNRWRYLWASIGALIWLATASADERKWVTLKGQIVWDGPIKKQDPIDPKGARSTCTNDKDGVLEEDFLIDPKSNGLKDVFVWIQPTGADRRAPFPAADIHPKLARPEKLAATIQQPCCRFIPHVLAARAGQTLTIENNAPFAHNVKHESIMNGAFNPLIPSGSRFEFPKPLVADAGPIVLTCNIHPWMKAYVRVFDHPYFAVTDADGKFEIKLAPTGKFSLFVCHPVNGYLEGPEGKKNGKPYEIANDLDVGTLKMKENKN